MALGDDASQLIWQLGKWLAWNGDAFEQAHKQ